MRAMPGAAHPHVHFGTAFLSGLELPSRHDRVRGSAPRNHVPRRNSGAIQETLWQRDDGQRAGLIFPGLRACKTKPQLASVAALSALRCRLQAKVATTPCDLRTYGGRSFPLPLTLARGGADALVRRF